MIPHSRPWITQEDIVAVTHRLKSHMISRGKETEAFEFEFASMTGQFYTKATSSGTSAIVVALKALGIKSGDEVIIPTYVCSSVKQAICAIGAKSVLCDIGSDWIMTAESVIPKISYNTKAIIAVHIFGIAVDSLALRTTGIPVVEDCCQALGHNSDGKWIGTAGDIAVYSLHPTKCLAAGEGGVVATNRPDIAQLVDDIFTENKTLFSFSDLQAALARSQMLRYESVLKRRQSIAHQYFEFLPEETTTSLRKLKDRSMFFRFPLVWRGNFSEIQRRLADRGIQVRRGVDTLLHRQANLEDKDFPDATDVFLKTISIPILPQLTDDEVLSITREIVFLFQEMLQ